MNIYNLQLNLQRILHSIIPSRNRKGEKKKKKNRIVINKDEQI